MFSGFPEEVNKCYCLLAKENPYTEMTRKIYLALWLLEHKKRGRKPEQGIHPSLNRHLWPCQVHYLSSVFFSHITFLYKNTVFFQSHMVGSSQITM